VLAPPVLPVLLVLLMLPVLSFLPKLSVLLVLLMHVAPQYMVLQLLLAVPPSCRPAAAL
jgi:hypothetical protein